MLVCCDFFLFRLDCDGGGVGDAEVISRVHLWNLTQNVQLDIDSGRGLLGRHDE